MTDEEDGRPGFVALQFGHVDALTDVPTAFLCHARTYPTIFRIARFSRNSSVVSHPSRKDNYAARVGHPLLSCLNRKNKKVRLPECRKIGPTAGGCTIKEKPNEDVPGK